MTANSRVKSRSPPSIIPPRNTNFVTAHNLKQFLKNGNSNNNQAQVGAISNYKTAPVTAAMMVSNSGGGKATDRSNCRKSISKKQQN